jgi:hypothetical protein
MFWIGSIIVIDTIGANSQFGDSGGDIVIDAEGHCTVGYCLVPKNRFNKKLTFGRWLMRIHDRLDSHNQTVRFEILLQLRKKPISGCETTNVEHGLHEKK